MAYAPSSGIPENGTYHGTYGTLWWHLIEIPMVAQVLAALPLLTKLDDKEVSPIEVPPL